MSKEITQILNEQGFWVVGAIGLIGMMLLISQSFKIITAFMACYNLLVKVCQSLLLPLVAIILIVVGGFGVNSYLNKDKTPTKPETASVEVKKEVKSEKAEVKNPVECINQLTTNPKAFDDAKIKKACKAECLKYAQTKPEEDFKIICKELYV